MRKELKFKIVDLLYILGMVVPLVCGVILKVLTTPKTEGITITGARVFLEIPMPLQPFYITESQVNSFLVILVIFFFCLYLTHGLKDNITLKRQHFTEMIVEKIDGMVRDNMGEYFLGFAPFVIAIMALSAFSSLISLLGLYPPTSDINIVGGWAILVFILITYYKMKCGPLNYLKSFTEPVAVLTPINIISEFATPVSMAFRHYGNVLAGSVISVLLASALGGLSNKLLASLPGFLAEFPILRVGIPAVLSIYFDVFGSLLQAFIFALLTMIYVSGGFNLELFNKRKAKKLEKKAKRQGL